MNKRSGFYPDPVGLNPAQRAKYPYSLMIKQLFPKQLDNGSNPFKGTNYGKESKKGIGR
jgi:hypothetical protein